jgi:hypothetical protein
MKEENERSIKSRMIEIKLRRMMDKGLKDDIEEEIKNMLDKKVREMIIKG